MVFLLRTHNGWLTIYIYISGLFLERIWNEITMGKAFWMHILQIRKWRMIETAELLQYTSVFSSWMQNIMKSYVIFIAGASLKSLWKNWRKSEQQQTGEKRVALTSHCTKTKKEKKTENFESALVFNDTKRTTTQKSAHYVLYILEL